MNITGFTFTKTKQVAQYEPEVLEVHVALDGEDFVKAATEVRKQVTGILSGVKVKTSAKVEEKAEETKATTEEKAPAKKAPAKKAPAKKAPAKKKKDIAYDRSVDAHKTAFGQLLISIEPDWQKDADLKAKAKEASTSLEGEMMFNADGDILPEFKEKVEAIMSGGEEASEDEDL